MRELLIKKWKEILNYMFLMISKYIYVYINQKHRYLNHIHYMLVIIYEKNCLLHGPLVHSVLQKERSKHFEKIQNYIVVCA